MHDWAGLIFVKFPSVWHKHQSNNAQDMPQGWAVLELTGTLLLNSVALSQFCLFLPDTTGANNISWSTGSIRNTFSCCFCGESEHKFINYKHFQLTRSFSLGSWLQSNPVNVNTEGVIKSVLVKWVTLFKTKVHLLLYRRQKLKK